MQSYQNYKNSEVEWIGKIPSHWKVVRINKLSTVKRGASPRPIDDLKYFSDNGEYSWVRIEDVTVSNKFLKKTTQRLSSLGKSLSVPLEPGEIFISIAGSVGKPIISQIKCCIHDGFVYFERLKISPDYLYWIFIGSEPYRGLGKLGTQLNLNTETIGNIKIPLPPPDEQTSITKYLDVISSRFDKIILEEKRLIELLIEKRAALINQAVTRGLDPEVKLRDSGIEWINQIPESWELKRLKFLVDKIGSGITPKGGSLIYQTYGIPLIRSQNVHFNGLRLDDVAYISEEIFKTMLNTATKKHDVLLNITGASIGRCTFIEDEFEKGNVNQHVCIIRLLHKKLFYKYLNYFLMSSLGQDQILSVEMGTSREGLTFEQIGNLRLPLPSLTEQIQIAKYLENETSKIDSVIERIQHRIMLLEEYKKSLINSVVTGKIDVRHQID